MGKTWKILLGLALALPMLAYVAGSLVAASDEPADRPPIEFVEGDTPSSDVDGTDGQQPKGKKRKKHPGTNGPGQGPGSTSPDRDPNQTPGPKIIKPSPRDLDDDDWDDDDDDWDDDDDGDDDD